MHFDIEELTRIRKLFRIVLPTDKWDFSEAIRRDSEIDLVKSYRGNEDELKAVLEEIPAAFRRTLEERVDSEFKIRLTSGGNSYYNTFRLVWMVEDWRMITYLAKEEAALKKIFGISLREPSEWLRKLMPQKFVKTLYEPAYHEVVAREAERLQDEGITLDHLEIPDAVRRKLLVAALICGLTGVLSQIWRSVVKRITAIT